ncbi:hypothetical protein RFI_35217, partial [Reticulomyxa filosa]
RQSFFVINKNQKGFISHKKGNTFVISITQISTHLFLFSCFLETQLTKKKKKRKTKKYSSKKINSMLMLHEEEDKVKKLKTLSLDGCYDKEWVASSNKPKLFKNFQCLLCKQIANNAMDLVCNEHEDRKEAVLIGEQCLKRHLNEHNNQCPIGNHDNCNYVKAQTTRNCIRELK